MVQMSSTSSTSKGGFTLCNAVASNEAIEKGQGRTMLLATRLHATPLACLHYAARLQRRDIHLSPAHRVASLSHSNESVALITNTLRVEARLWDPRVPTTQRYTNAFLY